MSLNSTKSRRPTMDDFDDIPVAVRDTRTISSPAGNRRIFWIAGISAALVGLLGGAIAAFVPALFTQSSATSSPSNPVESSSASEPITPGASTATRSFVEGSTPAATGENVQNQDAQTGADGPKSEAILGHFPYPEISRDRLTVIAPGIDLANAAAEAYRAMESDASVEGVRLVPLSGFRTKEDQEYLFFGVKGQRGQTAKERAKVSAPPGHSEHHTGYALDIGDADASGTNLSESFENTRAFQWLEQNAPYYSFELSFPEGNEQGVSYEPWHWRYVGNQESLEMFHKGRS